MRSVTGRAALAAALVLLATACGDSTPAASGGGGADPIAPVATSAPATDPTTEPTDDDCSTDRHTLEVALEAYYARYGAYPTSQAELVGEMLRVEIPSFAVGPDGTLTRVEGAACVAPAQESNAEPRTVEDFLAVLGDDGISRVGGIECATELAVIGVAGERFVAREGREPESLDELADDLDAPITRWAYDAGDDELRPVAGSGCVDLSVLDDVDRCDAERRTLDVASEAYRAREGESPIDQQALVDAGLLFEATPHFEIVDGIPVAVPGSECEVPLPVEIAGECATDYRTLQVAIEAYQAEFRRLPDNEQQLVDAELLRSSYATWDVVYGELVPGDGSPCEPPR